MPHKICIWPRSRRITSSIADTSIAHTAFNTTNIAAAADTSTAAAAVAVAAAAVAVLMLLMMALMMALRA